MTILVIQALKTLGKEYVDEKTIRVLSRRLNEDEKAALLAEGTEATDWIYTVIKEICKGEDQLIQRVVSPYQPVFRGD